MYAVDLRDVRWRKSSCTAGGNGNCVEVAFAGPAVAVRDSKDPDGPGQAFPASSWSAFMNRLPER